MNGAVANDHSRAFWEMKEAFRRVVYNAFG